MPSTLPVLTTPGQGIRNTVPGAGFTFGIDGGAATGVSEIMPGSITTAAMSANLTQLQVFNLTTANILGMFATPVVLIPAPGAGKSIVVDYILFRMIATATSFASGGVVTIGYNGGAAVANTLAAAIINAAGPGTVDTLVVTGASNITATQNAAVQISNATGAFTTGTGNANIFIWYSIV
jgi:hypothetical protein